jgi:hypothetical protein
MVYAKYITRMDNEGNPVKYGPYYYKSVRTSDGKVRNIYLGTEPPKTQQEENKKTLQALRDMLSGVF